MLLLISSAFAGAAAANGPNIGWPCQRLNWAWRSVWVTCGIVATGPSSTGAVVGSLANFFHTTNDAPQAALAQTNVNGVFVAYNTVLAGGIQAVQAPKLCTSATPAGQANFQRNRCRRQLDIYGNLVRLCSAGPVVSKATTNTISAAGVMNFLPEAAHLPHSQNVIELAKQTMECVTPGPRAPSTAGTCRGLNGWFTVVWNACGFTNDATIAANVDNIPNFLTPTAGAFDLTPQVRSANLVPGFFCGTGAVSATNWNPKGPIFRLSRCRRALDQFGRAAALCNGGATAGNADPLRTLAVNLVTQGTWCGAA